MSSSPNIFLATHRIKEYLTSITTVAGIITTSAALIIYAYLGLFSRYYADDFCLSGMLFQQGFWQAQFNSYMTWSNRYAGMFLVAVSELFGHSSIRVWTALVILLGIASLAWMIWQVFRMLRLPFPKIQVLLLAELVLFFTLLITPQLYQVLFWRIGLITYTLPLVFLAVLIGLVIRSASAGGQLKPASLLWPGLLSHFAGGFSETYLSLQIASALLALLLVFLIVKGDGRSKWLMLLGSALAGSVIAALVVVTSPGNASRLAFMPEPPGVPAFLVMVPKNAFIFIYSSLAEHFFVALLSVLIPMLLVYLHYARKPALLRWSPSALILAILVAPFTAFVLVAAVVAPAAYVQSSYPDGRVLVEATFVLVLLLMVEGFLIGVAFSQLHQYSGESVPVYLQLVSALLLLTLLLYPAYDVMKTSAQIGEFKAFAGSWDARDARIRSARLSGLSDIQEKAYNAPGGLSELSSDSENWVNACASWFYDLQSITADSP